MSVKKCFTSATSSFPSLQADDSCLSSIAFSKAHETQLGNQQERKTKFRKRNHTNTLVCIQFLLQEVKVNEQTKIPGSCLKREIFVTCFPGSHEKICQSLPVLSKDIDDTWRRRVPWKAIQSGLGNCRSAISTWELDRMMQIP